MVKNSDLELLAAAKKIISERYRSGWHVVGAALRLRTGQVVTGVHLEANVGRIAVCAEAVALGRAVTEFGSSDIETVAAVYHDRDGRIRLVAPCGMCREMISDYSPCARILMPDPEAEYTAVPVMELLPAKYTRE